MTSDERKNGMKVIYKVYYGDGTALSHGDLNLVQNLSKKIGGSRAYGKGGARVSRGDLTENFLQLLSELIPGFSAVSVTVEDGQSGLSRCEARIYNDMEVGSSASIEKEPEELGNIINRLMGRTPKHAQKMIDRGFNVSESA